MKYSLIVLLCLLLAGIAAPAQNPVKTMEVSYRQKPLVNSDTLNRVSIISKIVLNDSVNAAVIKFKVKDADSDSLIYSVQYALSTAEVVDANGLLLFKHQDNIIYINSNAFVDLKIYKYEVVIEDGEGNPSQAYSDFY